MSWNEKRHEVVLKYPVKWGEENVQTLVFKPLTAENMMTIKVDQTGSMEFGQMLKIAGDILETEGALTLIKMLHATDAMKVVALVSDFLDGSQEIGN